MQKWAYRVMHVDFFGICDGVFSIGIFIGIGGKNARVSAAGGETRRQGSVGGGKLCEAPCNSQH